MTITTVSSLSRRSKAGLLLCCCWLAVVLPTRLSGQASTDCWQPADFSATDSARVQAALGRRVLMAARHEGSAPRVDGRLDDPAWCAARPVTDFVQSGPSPGALATLPSVARVLFDDEAIYVGLRLEDTHPDSLVAPYPRRDDEVNSDWVFVEIDSRFDRRSGFSFGVNPRGVQADGAWSDDVAYDGAWNGVWDGAAVTDSSGWSAEFRIPYSQLSLGKSAPGSPLVWGINFYRYIPHRGEVSNWSPRLPSVVGVVSHFNELRGLLVPPQGARLEAVPYTAVSETRSPATGSPGVGSNASALTARAGVDLRFRPTAATTVALSLHPDFGQVEADPSQVNLTTFETFLPEQRPLFVQGSDVFQFDASLDFASRSASFAQESPFYSRRIGRPPGGSCPPGALQCRMPGASPVLGALRASGRTGNGWSGGLFQAWTGAQRAEFLDQAGRSGKTLVEPLTHFSVMRAVREFDGSRGALGGVATFVGRLGLRDGVDSLVMRDALVVGADGRLRFGRDGFQVTGFTLVSRVNGSASAIRALRREPRHGYYRPDSLGTAPSDSGAPPASLSGITAQARVARIEGRWQGGIAGRLVSPGFEANDVGFQRNANWLLAAADWKYLVYRPGRTIRRWSIGSRQVGVGWTFQGETRAATANLTATVDLRNYWGGSIALDHEFPARDPEVLRGGPALRLPGRDRWALTMHSDTRRRWQLDLALNGEHESATGSNQTSFSPDFSAFLTDRLQVGLSPLVGFVQEAWQYVAQPGDSSGRAHYLLGEMRQTTASLSTRATYAFSAHLTLQLYGQIFLSGGRFRNFKEVIDPLAREPQREVAVIAPSRLGHDSATGQFVVDDGLPLRLVFESPDFSERDLHFNLLLRWEFLRGSTLFLVWTHQRTSQEVTDFRLDRDLGQLWRTPAENVLVAKLSYWLSG